MRGCLLSFLQTCRNQNTSETKRFVPLCFPFWRDYPYILLFLGEFYYSLVRSSSFSLSVLLLFIICLSICISLFWFVPTPFLLSLTCAINVFQRCLSHLCTTILSCLVDASPILSLIPQIKWWYVWAKNHVWCNPFYFSSSSFFGIVPYFLVQFH